MTTHESIPMHRLGCIRNLLALIGTAVVALSVSGPAGAALASSDFESGADGWLGYACDNPGVCFGIASGGNLAIDHVTSGGNPPGASYIETVDPGSDTAARVEPNPAKYSGLYALGNVLSFDARVDSNGGGGVYDLNSYAAAPLLAIETPLSLLVYLATDLPDIDGGWKHYDVPLVNGPNWILATLAGIVAPDDAQFAAALASMTRLTLISEWLKDGGDVDTGGIDNFRVVVPVPAALPLLGSVLMLLGVRHRG